MTRQMPPRWRRAKPDKPGLWLLYRPGTYHRSDRFMEVNVTQATLDSGTVEQWSADWWMRIPDFPGEV